MPRFKMPERDRSEMLAAYDRASQGDVRSQRMALDLEKFDYKQAMDAAELNRKAAADAQRAEVAESRNSLYEKQNEIRLAAQELKDLEAQRKADRSLEVLTQAKGWLRDAQGMKPTANEFDAQLQGLQAGYPDALEHPAVKTWFEYNTGRRNEYLKSQPALNAAAGLPIKRATADGVTYEALEPAKPTSDTDKVVDFDKEIKTKYGFGLADLTSPTAKPRLVRYDDKGIEVGDPKGTHFAINVKDGSETRTQAIPVGEYKGILARKALLDPNASEAHKVAAKRLLGVR